MEDLKAILEERVWKFQQRVTGELSKVEQYAAEENILEWPDLKDAKLRPDDKGHFRRINYIYHRVIESIERLTKKDITDNKFPLDGKSPSDLLGKYEKNFEKWKSKCVDYEKFARRFHFADVVRRLKDNSELGPLLVSSLDPELFTACYILRYHRSEILPKERVLLYERIWREVRLYVTQQLPYHDLSTLWWGVNIIKDWGKSKLEDGTPKLEDKIEALRCLLELSLKCKNEEGKLVKEGLLTDEGQRLKSYDRNGDLVTPRRSLVFCYQNAVEVRTWLEKLHNPRLLPLVKMIRGWSDSCAKYWLDIPPSDRLYDAALDLALCAEWWKDRVSHWGKAIKIFDHGKQDFIDVSPIKKISTTNVEFGRELTRVVNTVKMFREFSVDKGKPLVVALFGPPGSGKSAIAKGIDEASLIELNLSVCETPKEFFTTLSEELNQKNAIQKPILFLDEFDTRMGGGYWYHWLLTLLGDGKFPAVDKRSFVDMKPIPESSVVFLAASRYEKFEHFRDFALSPEAKNHKASDLLTRIDISLNIPRLEPADRALVMASKAKFANDGVLALCYIAELEDNARGITKLLKGVNREAEFGLNNLTPAAKDSLYEAAGLIGEF